MSRPKDYDFSIQWGSKRRGYMHIFSGTGTVIPYLQFEYNVRFEAGKNSNDDLVELLLEQKQWPCAETMYQWVVIPNHNGALV